MTEQEIKFLLLRMSTFMGEDVDEANVDTFVRSVTFMRECGAAAGSQR